MNVEKQNSLIKEAHENAVRHGFWAEQLSDEHFLCLVICELAEAVEAKRNGSFCTQKNWHFFEERIAEQPSQHEAATEAERYSYWFEHFVKDTLGDELADAYIRLCDLAGAHGMVVKEHRGMLGYVVSEERTFTENVLAIEGMLTDGSMSIDGRLLFGMRQVERLAELEVVDLLKHIKYKMRYNKLRQHKHGKAF